MVLADDPVGDRQAQAGPLADPPPGEERLEDVLEHLGRHAAAVVGEDHLGHPLGVPEVDPERAAGVHRVERVDDQVQDDLLDLLAVDVGHDGLAGLEDDVLAPVLAHVADHLDDPLDQAGQVGPLALDVGAAGEVEQLLGDALAAERLLLDHPQVVADDLGVGAVGGVDQERAEPVLQRLGAEGDRGQRVVDLVGDPGGEEPDARQPLGADELPAPLLDLALEVGVGHAQPRGHVVERLGQPLHLVAGVQVDLVVERAPRHPTDPALQEPDGIEDPAVEQGRQAAEHRQDRQGRGPDDHPARLVLPLRHQQDRVEVAVELVGQLHHPAVQPLDPRVQARPPPCRTSGCRLR